MLKKKPTVVSTSFEQYHVMLELSIDADIVYFQGHFADFALLPGVTQIEWVVLFAHEYLGISGTFLGMDAMKFQQPIRPGSRLSLTITWQPKTHKLHFTYHAVESHENYSTGKIKLGDVDV